MEPETANIGTGMPEREFDVGHTLSVWWEAYGYTADGSPAEGSFIYDSEVYLSENDTLEPDDKLLFSMECLAPSSGNQEYACSQYASFRCDYESGLSLSCLSLPLDHPVGFKDKRIDLSDFLNIVPKTANIIYKVCLNETEVCDLATTQIVLN
ncbi:MAG: hypothetical protein CME36_02760 [unclassified Hahellaceae]|nr:hypothetical protein [Hahellaceae bacterium]